MRSSATLRAALLVVFAFADVDAIQPPAARDIFEQGQQALSRGSSGSCRYGPSSPPI